MLRFAYPHMLWFLLVIPLLVFFYLAWKSWRRKNLEQVVEENLHSQVFLNSRAHKATLRFIFYLLILLFLIIAMADPQIGTRLEMVKRKGVDVVVVLDVSRSMLSTDVAPSRLMKAKKEIWDLTKIMEGDRIGIIVFSGEAFVQVPLTIDYGAVEMYLDYIEPGIIPRPGTNISAALNLAVNAFKNSEEKYRVVILMTDGEDTESREMDDLLEKIKEKNIKIYSIGFGSPEGSLIPETDEQGNVTGYKKDKSGNYVTSKLNETLLRRIASTSGGEFYYASAGSKELEHIYRSIRKMEQRQITEREYSHFEDRFQYFLSLALLLLIVQIIWIEAGWRWK